MWLSKSTRRTENRPREKQVQSKQRSEGHKTTSNTEALTSAGHANKPEHANDVDAVREALVLEAAHDRHQ